MYENFPKNVKHNRKQKTHHGTLLKTTQYDIPSYYHPPEQEILRNMNTANALQATSHTNSISSSTTTKNLPVLLENVSDTSFRHSGVKRKLPHAKKYHNVLSYSHKIQSYLATDSPECLAMYLQERRKRYPTVSQTEPNVDSNPSLLTSSSPHHNNNNDNEEEIRTFSVPSKAEKSSSKPRKRRISLFRQVSYHHLFSQPTFSRLFLFLVDWFR
jgi:hypothetical protein